MKRKISKKKRENRRKGKTKFPKKRRLKTSDTEIISVDKKIEIARSWLDTPWRHNCQIKGEGVDCINFLAGVAAETGLKIAELPNRYSRIAVNGGIEKFLNDHFERKKEIGVWYAVLIEFSGYHNHVAITTSENTIIHASVLHKRVVEHKLDGIWKNSIVGYWEIK